MLVRNFIILWHLSHKDTFKYKMVDTFVRGACRFYIKEFKNGFQIQKWLLFCRLFLIHKTNNLIWSEDNLFEKVTVLDFTLNLNPFCNLLHSLVYEWTKFENLDQNLGFLLKVNSFIQNLNHKRFNLATLKYFKGILQIYDSVFSHFVPQLINFFLFWINLRQNLRQVKL